MDGCEQRAKRGSVDGVTALFVVFEHQVAFAGAVGAAMADEMDDVIALPGKRPLQLTQCCLIDAIDAEPSLLLEAGYRFLHLCAFTLHIELGIVGRTRDNQQHAQGRGHLQHLHPFGEIQVGTSGVSLDSAMNRFCDLSKRNSHGQIAISGTSVSRRRRRRPWPFDVASARLAR